MRDPLGGRPPRVFGATPRVPEALQRSLDVDGEAFGLVANALQPVVVALNLLDHQYLKLAGINSFACGSSPPAVAGAASIATLRNPIGSGRIFAIRRIIVGAPGANMSVWWGVLSGAAVPAVLNPAVITPLIRDTRQLNAAGLAQTSAASVIYGTTLGSPGVGEATALIAGSASQQFALEQTVAPGGWFFVVAGTANTTFACSISWEERVAQTSELNLPG